MRNIKSRLIVLLTSLMLISPISLARMYQWTEPETGSTQLSGKPPVWYRSESGGPRVFVFENGRLIDDTGIEVEDDVRQGMRQAAFIQAEEDKQKANEKIAKSKELKQKFADEESEEQNNIELSTREELIENVPVINEPIYQEDLGSDETSDDKNLDDLRKLISDWEKDQSESNKKLLE